MKAVRALHQRTVEAMTSAVLITLASCSDGGAANPTAQPRGIEAAPPYLCTVVPESAVARIHPTASSPDHGTLSDSPEGRFTGDKFSCAVNSADGFELLIYEHHKGTSAEDAYGQALEYLQREKSETAPARLGVGYFEDLPVPLLRGWLYWRCGDTTVFSEISYRVPHEDESRLEHDTFRLLEIAQQRYAEINDCEVRPPTSSPPESTPSSDESPDPSS